MHTFFLEYIGERPYPCDQCNKAFKQANCLSDHKKFVHQGIQKIHRFACEICDKGFFNRTTLKNHLNIHTAGSFIIIQMNIFDCTYKICFTGEKPYACDHLHNRHVWQDIEI